MEPNQLISPGDEIKIRLQPGEQPPTPTATATPVQRYTIREGDTAWAVSARFGISLDELLAWNNLPQDPLLSVGQELWVTAPTAEQPAVAADVDQGIAPAEATPDLPTPQPTIAAQSQSPAATPIVEQPPTATATPPAEVALVSDNSSAESPVIDDVPISEPEANVEVVQVNDQPETILNLPLILGVLALIFLGIGGWLFMQSRRVT